MVSQNVHSHKFRQFKVEDEGPDGKETAFATAHEWAMTPDVGKAAGGD